MDSLQLPAVNKNESSPVPSQFISATLSFCIQTAAAIYWIKCGLCNCEPKSTGGHDLIQNAACALFKGPTGARAHWCWNGIDLRES